MLPFVLVAGLPACFPLKEKGSVLTTSHGFEMNKQASATHTYAWNALHRDLSHTLFEAGESWVNLPDLALFPLNQLLYNLLRHLRFTHSAAKAPEWTSAGLTDLLLSFDDV